VHEIEKNEMGGACSMYGGRAEVLVGKPEGKRPFARPQLRWQDNIKMNLQEVEAWIGSVWFRIGTVGGHL
jgi:hypothetical protein